MRGQLTRPLYNRDLTKVRRRRQRERQDSNRFNDDVTRDVSQRRFLAQHSVATLLRHCFGWLQHCSSIAALCCAKNRGCESSRVTSPLIS